LAVRNPARRPRRSAADPVSLHADRGCTLGHDVAPAPALLHTPHWAGDGLPDELTVSGHDALHTGCSCQHNQGRVMEMHGSRRATATVVRSSDHCQMDAVRTDKSAGRAMLGAPRGLVGRQVRRLVTLSTAGPQRRWMVIGATISVAVIVALAITVGFLLSNEHELQGLTRSADLRIAALRADLVATAHASRGVGDRVSRLEGRVALEPDTAAIASTVAPSVYEVDAGDMVGTAWVVGSSGGRSELVTNAHVVGDALSAGQQSVTLVRGSNRLQASITRVSDSIDLAVLSVSQSLPPLEVTTHSVAIGDPLVVVGSSLGLEGSVSSGIVSALRSAGGEDYVQFSAPISPGNSGGPVVDRESHVIGVTTLKAVAEGAEGLGFAIPVSTVCRILVPCGQAPGPRPPHAQGPLRPS
jgi:S1-C subfamily serine protease